TPAAGTFTNLSATDLTTNLTATGELRLTDDDASDAVTLKAHDTTTDSYTLTLPAGAPASNGQLLSVDTAGQLSWATPAGGGDMMASTYDGDANGKVDLAEDAEQLGGQAPGYYDHTTAGYLTGSSSLNATNVTSGSMAPARITQDAANRFVTDTQIAGW